MVPDQTIATDDMDDEGGADAKRKAGDLAPVAEPGALVFHLRFKSLTHTVSTFASFAQLPPQLVDEAMDVMAKEMVSELLSGKVDGRAFRDVLDLSAPIDVVAMADTSKSGQIPEPMAAISIGLTSMARARAAATGRGRKLADGVWRIGPAESWGDACAIAEAAGRAPARLICGSSPPWRPTWLGTYLSFPSSPPICGPSFGCEACSTNTVASGPTRREVCPSWSRISRTAFPCSTTP